MKPLRAIGVIFGRELAAYFNSPIAYLFIVVFVLLTATLYMTQFFLIGLADMRPYFDVLPFILCVFIPAVTMRLWAEERRSNTVELLLTFPLQTRQLVLGKYLAGLVFYLITLAGTLLIPFMLFRVGTPDPGPLAGGYVGAILTAGLFLSIGIFISGLCRDQIVAFIGAMMVCFLFFLIGIDFIAVVIDGWVPGFGTFLRTNIAMTPHVNGFNKGVIAVSDVAYFAVMSAVFLFLNMCSLEDRLRPKAKLIFTAAVAVSLAIGVTLNVLIRDMARQRIDLTQGRIYTLTDAAKRILKGLQAPVQVKLYISPAEKMPTAFKTLEQDIKDQMDEFTFYGQGKFNYSVIHQEAAGQEQKPDAATAPDSLERRGIMPFQVQSVDQDEVGIRLIYSALAIAYKDREEEIIPTVTPENLNNLEYEIMAKVFRMTLAQKPRVALMAPYEDKNVDPRMLALLRQLGQAVPQQFRDDPFRPLEQILDYEGYEYRRLRLVKDDPLPEGTTTLIVAEPERLSERQRYEISRFLRQGGNVIIAAQRYTYAYRPAPAGGIEVMPQQMDLGALPDLLQDYGLRISDDMLMDEENTVVSVEGAASVGPFAMAVPLKVPIHILVKQDTMNQQTAITGRLSTLFYLWGSPLVLDEARQKEFGLRATVLLTSSKHSWTVPFRGASLGYADVERQGAGYNGLQPLAVLIEGQFPFSYSGKPAPQWDAEPGATPEPEQPAAEPKAKPGKLLLVGCSKMFEERVIRNGGMINFFSNAVDIMTLGGELIEIRSRRPIDRSVRALDNVAKSWYRFLTMGLVPLLVLVGGAIRTVLRRRERERYIKSLAAARPQGGAA